MALLAIVIGLGQPVSADSTIRIGVMLPFKQGSSVSERAVDFYRGLMISVDSLRHTGQSCRVYTYNTADKPISQILRDTIIPHLDIIFGPDEASTLKSISDFTSPHGIKWVDAVCPVTSTLATNPHLVRAYPSDKLVVADITALYAKVFQKTNLIIVDTGRPVHPLINALKQMKDTKIRYLQAGFTASQLKSRLSQKRINIVVPSSADNASAASLLREVSALRQVDSQCDLRVLGYPEWQDSQSGSRSQFAKANTYIYCSYFYQSGSARAQRFAQIYRRYFRKDFAMGYPAMAPYGFDLGYTMLKGLMHYGRAYAGQSVYAAPLQSTLQFQRQDGGGGLVNHKMLFIHYKPTGGVELIERK